MCGALHDGELDETEKVAQCVGPSGGGGGVVTQGYDLHARPVTHSEAHRPIRIPWLARCQATSVVLSRVSAAGSQVYATFRKAVVTMFTS